jgi:hypothetical protein
VNQSVLDAAGWAAGAGWAGAPPAPWPAVSGLPAGTLDEGYSAAAAGFLVTRVRLFTTSQPGTNYTYTVLAPDSTQVGVLTPAQPGWSDWLAVPAQVGDGRGIWTIQINHVANLIQAPPLLEPANGAAGNAVGETYVVMEKPDATRSPLGIEFDGQELPPGKTCWQDVELTRPAAVPCQPPDGGPVTVTWTAIVTPAVPAYQGGYEWQITDQATGGILQPYQAGGPTFTYTVPRPGAYKATVKIDQPDCPEGTLIAADNVTVEPCTACAVSLSGPDHVPCSSGAPVDLAFTASAGPGYTGPYAWEVRNTTAGPGSPPLYQAEGGTTFTYAFPGPGSYMVTVSMQTAGCAAQTAADSSTIEIPDCSCPSLSSPQLSLNQVTPCSWNFSAAVIFPPAPVSISFTWDFGDGQSAVTTVPSTSHTYQADGPRHVTVTMRAGGCQDMTASADIIVAGCVPPPAPPPKTSSACAGLLIAAIVVLAVGTVVLVIGVCSSVFWLEIIGGVLAVAGLILLAIWALVCASVTPCALIRQIHCVIAEVVKWGWLIAVFATWTKGLDCGFAAAAAWGGWGSIYAWLGTIMRAAGCTPTC